MEHGGCGNVPMVKLKVILGETVSLGYVLSFYSIHLRVKKSMSYLKKCLQGSVV